MGLSEGIADDTCLEYVSFFSRTTSEFFSDPVDLQLDYWVSNQSSGPSDVKRSSDSGSKNSIKTSIRYMLIQRSNVHSGGTEGYNSSFMMQYWVKEKKQKSKYSKE